MSSQKGMVSLNAKIQTEKQKQNRLKRTYSLCEEILNKQFSQLVEFIMNKEQTGGIKSLTSNRKLSFVSFAVYGMIALTSACSAQGYSGTLK